VDVGSWVVILINLVALLELNSVSATFLTIFTKCRLINFDYWMTHHQRLL
jgi:hypothetical protein